MQNQNLFIIKQIRPLIVQLITALGELPPIEQSTYDPCVEGSDEEIRACLIDEIVTYGISREDIDNIPYLQSNEHLLIFLRALQTVGQQILECLRNCFGDDSPYTSPDMAFQAVFPEITLEVDDNLKFQAEAAVQVDGNGQPYGTISFPITQDFYECVVEEEGVRYPEITGATCNPGYKPQFVTFENSGTFEAIFRHEIGHIFLGLLKREIDGSRILTDLSREAAYDVDNFDPENPDNDLYFLQIMGRYFPNYGDHGGTEELFGDTFSVLGRFVGEGDFYGILQQPRLIPYVITDVEAEANAQRAFPDDEIISVELGRLSPENVYPVWIITFDFGDDEDNVMLIDGITNDRLYIPSVSRHELQSTITDDELAQQPAIPSDEETLANSKRVQYMQDNFCCWVGQLLENSSDDIYNCLCPSDN